MTLLRSITLIVNYGLPEKDAWELVPAWITDEKFQRAVFIYEGRVHFCETRSTTEKNLFFEGHRSISLGELEPTELEIFRFIEMLKSKTAYDFLAVDLLNEYQSNYEFNLIKEGR